MSPDTVQQFWSSKNVGIGYLSHMDLAPCVRTLCHNSNPAKMSESGIWTEWTRSHVSGHRARILIQQKCRNRVFESHMDSAPCVRTQCNNSNPAKMSESVVMSRGNPWVQQAIPIPLPPKTPTPHQGYGFLKGLNIHTLTPTPHTLD